MASNTINERITSINISIGNDATEFYIGFHLYEEQDYDSLVIFKILNELKNQSLPHMNHDESKNEQICLKNNIQGTNFELVAWTQGNTGINFQKIENIYCDAFIAIHKILQGKPTPEIYKS